MGENANNKFTWVIKDFPSSPTESIESDRFLIGDCKWFLHVYTSANLDNLYVYLCVADAKSLPSGWRRIAKCRLTVVNQPGCVGDFSETEFKFYEKTSSVHLRKLQLTKVQAKAGGYGFLVNKEVTLIAEVEVLQVVGKLDVFDESEQATQPLKKIKTENGVKSLQLKESVDVNGFHVLPSQVEFVKSLFGKHPDMALEFRAKSQHLRTACMNVLLGLVETLCQSLQELSGDDLVEAENALAYVNDAGFKVDWLENKLEEVTKKKKEEQNAETRTRELEEELKDLKQKCSNVEALLEKEKAKVLTARASPLSLGDFV